MSSTMFAKKVSVCKQLVAQRLKSVWLGKEDYKCLTKGHEHIDLVSNSGPPGYETTALPLNHHILDVNITV